MSQNERFDENLHGSRRKRQTEGNVNIDLGFGGLFKGLGNLIDLLSQMTEEGKSEINREGKVQGPNGIQGVYGVSVRMGQSGSPVLERFGNIQATERGPAVSPVREPMLDVFDEGDHILVITEIPGVAAADIRVDLSEDILNLSAEGGDRKYAKEVLLPAKADGGSIRQSYQNGILEIRLNKAGTSAT